LLFELSFTLSFLAGGAHPVTPAMLRKTVRIWLVTPAAVLDVRRATFFRGMISALGSLPKARTMIDSSQSTSLQGPAEPDSAEAYAACWHAHQGLVRGELRKRWHLYFRIAGWTCQLPPLRERREDIPALVQHFLKELYPGRAPLQLDHTVRDYLLAREYPGNVRELRQVVMRLASRHAGDGPITARDLPPEERVRIGEIVKRDWRDSSVEAAVRRALTMGVTLQDIKHDVAELAIRISVQDEDGNLQRASRKLGVTDRALQLRQACRRQGNGAPSDGNSDAASGRK
jgi:transcriptional regulator with AAA-type ATPase domain